MYTVFTLLQMHIDEGANIFAIKDNHLFFRLYLQAHSYTQASGLLALSQGVGITLFRFQVPIKYIHALHFMSQTIQSRHFLQEHSSTTLDLSLLQVNLYHTAALLILKIVPTCSNIQSKIILII
jgi:hypothetical protein